MKIKRNKIIRPVPELKMPISFPGTGWILMFIFTSISSFSQSDSLEKNKRELNFVAYSDFFYAWDFNQPKGEKRQDYFYNYNLHNTFYLNQAFVGFEYNAQKFHSKFIVQGGSYVDQNYASEPDGLKNIAEAYLGFSLGKNNKWNIDAGIFSSHIGFENTVSFDNLTLTRSLCAENSPYFESGLRLKYSANERLDVVGLVLNGWQNIQTKGMKDRISGGTQINWRPFSVLEFNWSTFFGQVDSSMRYFSNVYGKTSLGKKLKLIAGFDIGVQSDKGKIIRPAAWYSPVIIMQYAFSERYTTGLRFERYSDPGGKILGVQDIHIHSISANMDFKPSDSFIFRMEIRYFINKNADVFKRQNDLVRDDLLLTTGIAYRFQSSRKLPEKRIKL
ncbi:MAG: porin [Flavobacteriales bacterium]|nr:porin [Flavobacteriales bacterium]